ncbi:MAG: outer membrane beta-barrel protein, partial [Bacteroidota bacterium]
GITPRSWTALATKPSNNLAALVVPEGTMNAIVRAREESGAHVYQPLQKKARWLRSLINRGSLSVMAGVNESRGFRNNGRKGDGSTDPLFGIAYDYQLSPQWALSVEATYVRRAGHFLEQSSRRESFLLTRKVQERQVINEVTSHFQFPVLAKWTMKEDHRFAVGVYGSVLANVTGQMRESEYYELDPDADIHGIAQDTAINFSSQSGYSEGLSKWDFGIVLGYEYQLFRSLNLGARYQRGLVDFADNRIYSSAGTTNNDYLSDLQLYLRVQLVN